MSRQSIFLGLLSFFLAGLVVLSTPAAAQSVTATVNTYPIKGELGSLAAGSNTAYFISEHPEIDRFGHDVVRMVTASDTYTLTYDSTGRVKSLETRNGTRLGLTWLATGKADISLESYDGFTYRRSILRNQPLAAAASRTALGGSLRTTAATPPALLTVTANLKQCAVYPKAAQVMDAYIVYQLGSNLPFSRPMVEVSGTRFSSSLDISSNLNVARSLAAQRRALAQGINDACTVPKTMRDLACVNMVQSDDRRLCNVVFGGLSGAACAIQELGNEWIVKRDREKLADITAGARTVTIYVNYRTPNGDRVPAQYGPFTVSATATQVTKTLNLPCWTLAEGSVSVAGTHQTPSCTSKVRLDARFQASIPPAGSTARPRLRIKSTETAGSCATEGSTYDWWDTATSSAASFGYDHSYTCAGGTGRWTMSATRAGSAFSGGFTRTNVCGTSRKSYTYGGPLMVVK